MIPNPYSFYPIYHYSSIPQTDLNHPSYSFPYHLFFPFQQAFNQEPQQNLQIKTENLDLQCIEQSKSLPQSSSHPQSEVSLKKEKISRKKKAISIKSSGVIQQKQGRNANSNLLRMFFRRLHLRINTQEQQVHKIIRKYSLSISAYNFNQWFIRQDINFRNYIRATSVRKYFSKSSPETIIMRILLKDFIDHQSRSCYLTSRKLKKEMMSFSLRSLRVIYRELLQQ